jgi:hypothetical protein
MRSTTGRLREPCAVAAGADYLSTCDDRFLKRARAIHSGPPKVVNPLELVREIGS